VSPARLAECLAALGWSSRYLAILLSRDPRQVRRWLRGTPIPWQIDEWLESRVRQAERTPPPVRDVNAAE
jgi:hypothetical protein